MILGFIGETVRDALTLADLGLEYTYWQARAAGFSEGDYRAALMLSTFASFSFLLMAAFPEARSPALAAMVLPFPAGQYDWRRAVRMTMFGLLAVGCILLMFTAPTLSQDGGMTLKEVVSDHEARLRVLEKMSNDVELLKKIVFELVNWVKLGFGIVAAAILTYAVNGILKTHAAGKKAQRED